MGALAPYIPSKNANFVAWAANFATLIATSPATYGLVSGDAAAITAENVALQAAYTQITSPDLKTAATVAAYNATKILSLATFRPYAVNISLNAGVSTSNKTAIGVNPRTSVPIPITTPTTAPQLTFVSTSPAGTIIRYRDATSSPSVKAKPYGVIQIQIYGGVATTGGPGPIVTPTDPTTFPLITVATKSPGQIALGSPYAGKTVYWAARWLTRKGLVGPWSAVTPYVVAG